MDTLLTPDVVLTSAIEIGIGIAGFTGIVLALLRDSEPTVERRFHVFTLLLTSIATVFFSFLPLILMNINMSESTIWQISGSVFLVYFLFISLLRSNFKIISASLPVLKIGLVTFLISVLLQIPNVALWKAAWPYLTLIVAYVLYSFSVFVSLLWDVWGQSNRQPN